MSATERNPALRRTFGDLSVAELLASAGDESAALQAYLEDHGPDDELYEVIVRAYATSIGARVAVAAAKHERGEQS
ncbi:hypothetical protein [Streptomyces sp. AC1-42T]|uniref:hypothetical protein n=1 Tax=Streptomyces sp. AC1-42T TaxID=2218665 RepID=UPI000DABF610|nr:hypothetical protein [Streptomyces sp. AC1-42T]PZT71569.1 hypothetical protein DNK55_33230 [Streptomyces sp. AC1-42T]